VQHVVEQAIREVVRERVNLKGSSRTDAGVHAKGQVGAFSCSGEEERATGLPPGDPQHAMNPPSHPRGGGWPVSRGTDRLLRALNGRLPEDCLITAAELVPESFDPTRDTVAKGYSYTIHCARERPLWDRRFVHQVWEPLNVAPMLEAAKLLEGEHDFAAFAAAGHGRLSTVRTIFACDVSALPNQRVRIDVSGNGFLWNMVRIIAGTLVEIGRGRKTPADVPRIIESGLRAKAGPTLPPTGLCLEWIRFGVGEK